MSLPHRPPRNRWSAAASRKGDDEMTTLEICTNTEWLREHAGINLDRIEDGSENDAADDFCRRLWNRLESAGYTVERAKGQRMTLHGWNGANTFRHKLGPVGTFDNLTAEQESDIFGMIAEAQESVEREFAATDAE